MSSPITRMNDDLVKAHVPLLGVHDLCALEHTNKHFLRLFGSTCRAAELLFCVLNVNTARKTRIVEILSKIGASESKSQAERSIILTRTQGVEFFWNTKITKKLWSNVTPLEAAAKCGDFHLLRLMFNSVPLEQKPIAVAQLLKVREARSIPAELASYTLRIAKLRQAYKNFNETFNKEFSRDQKEKDKQIQEINRVSGLIGEAQKELPCFILQLFCIPIDKPINISQAFFNPSYRKPTADFTQEPTRDCVLGNMVSHEGRIKLDINSIGGSTSHALYKGFSCLVARECATNPHMFGTVVLMIKHDQKEFDSISEMIDLEIDKIIQSVPMPATGLTKLSSSKPTR